MLTQKPKSAHGGGVVGKAEHLLEDRARPGVGAGVQVAEGVDVVALAPAPRDVGEVEPVVDAEVHERREALLVDGVPQAELGGDPVVEPVQDREVVTTFGSGGEAEQLDGLHVVEKLAVRGRRRVVELVDDHDVEVIGREVVEIGGVETLDRSEDVFEVLWSCAADPLLTERRVAHRVTEGGDALIEDLIAVRDKQQARARQFVAKVRVVDGGHDGLAGTSGGDEQVAMVTACA